VPVRTATTLVKAAEAAAASHPPLVAAFATVMPDAGRTTLTGRGRIPRLRWYAPFQWRGDPASENAASMTNTVRKAVFLTLNLGFGWLLWPLLLTIRPFGWVRFLFLVYPGTDADLESYCPGAIARSWLCSGRPMIAGVVASRGTGDFGLVLAVPNTPGDFTRDPELCHLVVARLRRMEALSGARAIALAGQLPSVMRLRGITLHEPFVDGTRGTVFSIVDTIDQMMRLERMNKDAIQIVLIGVGYLGRRVLTQLQRSGFDVKGLDLRPDPRGDVWTGAKGIERLRHADVVVVMTGRGSDFNPYIEYLKPGAIVIDDTHPRITNIPDGVRTYKVAAELAGTRFVPRLPGYESTWVPGCGVEAMVAARTGTFEFIDQDVFNATARSLGFQARLIECRPPMAPATRRSQASPKPREA
jgi:hypothetical protein